MNQAIDPYDDPSHPYWDNPPTKWLRVTEGNYRAFHKALELAGAGLRPSAVIHQPDKEVRLWWGEGARGQRDVLAATYTTARGTERVLNMHTPIVQMFLSGFLD